ncbi:hypothetical protein [Actinokineospora inagensis]|uniref:hypothetical protein n=1 Tax=Actinokineospora inagensis TaxID=103730 RepID=UPI000425E5CE|nr:hypothetical protein [Actinokineospora inagensis]
MYIDEGANAPLSAIGQAMDDFALSAASGHFAINAHGGDALLAAIRNMAAWVDSQQSVEQTIAQKPKLGSSNNAEVVKPFMLEVAAGDQGFFTQLRQLRESLVKAEAAIKQAMANYQATDQSNAVGFA